MDLLVDEINRLIGTGLDFPQVVEAITHYQNHSKLLFVLAKVDNLVKNGRLGKTGWNSCWTAKYSNGW